MKCTASLKAYEWTNMVVPLGHAGYYLTPHEMCNTMAFECSQCGKCCMHMGDFIAIERQVGPYEYIGCSVSTGTPFPARIDEDKQHLFADRSWIEKHSSSCPFLRPSGERIVCTIHETSPAQCKAYRCVIARIRDSEGMDVGYVTGTLALHSSDPALRDAWSEVDHVIAAFPGEAEDLIAVLLGKRGYDCT